jgi:integrase
VASNQHSTIKGVHRVSKHLASGKLRVYHYAFRGGPKFWTSDSKANPDDPQYAIAYADAMRKAPTGIVKPGSRSTAAVIERYRRSAHFKNLAPRTQSDYEKYLTAFEADFGEDPIKMFEERASLSEIREWKDQWAHSGRQYDYATSVVTFLLNWAAKEDVSIEGHHHIGVPRLYKSDRADIIWRPEEIEALLAVATDREARIVIAASEGGLAPQDLGAVGRQHVQRTPMGRRIVVKRAKTRHPMAIPATPALEKLIDQTPHDQDHLVVSLEGRPLRSFRASQIVRDLKDRANEVAKSDSSATPVREELRGVVA